MITRMGKIPHFKITSLKKKLFHAPPKHKKEIERDKNPKSIQISSKRSNGVTSANKKIRIVLVQYGTQKHPILRNKNKSDRDGDSLQRLRTTFNLILYVWISCLLMPSYLCFLAILIHKMTCKKVNNK